MSFEKIGRDHPNSLAGFPLSGRLQPGTCTPLALVRCGTFRHEPDDEARRRHGVLMDLRLPHARNPRLRRRAVRSWRRPACGAPRPPPRIRLRRSVVPPSPYGRRSTGSTNSLNWEPIPTSTGASTTTTGSSAPDPATTRHWCPSAMGELHAVRLVLGDSIAAPIARIADLLAYWVERLNFWQLAP